MSLCCRQPTCSVTGPGALRRRRVSKQQPCMAVKMRVFGLNLLKTEPNTQDYTHQHTAQKNIGRATLPDTFQNTKLALKISRYGFIFLGFYCNTHQAVQNDGGGGVLIWQSRAVNVWRKALLCHKQLLRVHLLENYRSLMLWWASMHRRIPVLKLMNEFYIAWASNIFTSLHDRKILHLVRGPMAVLRPMCLPQVLKRCLQNIQ